MAEGSSLAQASRGAARRTHRPHSSPAESTGTTGLEHYPVRPSGLKQLNADERILAQFGEGLSAELVRRSSRIVASQGKGQEAIQPPGADAIPERRWSPPSRWLHRYSHLTVR